MLKVVHGTPFSLHARRNCCMTREVTEMLPRGIELRPEFSTSSDILAFGFSAQQVNDVQSLDLLAKELVDYLDKVASASPPRLVIVDMRNIVRLAAENVKPLLKIRQRSLQASWKLFLVIDEPSIRDAFIHAGLDKIFSIASGNEVGRLLSALTPSVQQAAASEDEGVEFTSEELQEVMTSGVTLDDAIQEIEKLRS
jgi:anti-anti-sigma regulatory factor